MDTEYRRFWIASSVAEERERLLAEAFEAGAEGAEELESEGLFRACVYAPAERVEAVRRAVRRAASRGAAVEPSEAIPRVDWSEAWKQGLTALRISSRLVVRPPFAEVELEPGQREVVIEPGQAFGTGAHASTRLCLEWIDALLGSSAGRGRFDRMLDVGTGSGVLALAAVALGAERAVGLDLDPIAIAAADEAARRNGLAERVHFATGPIESVLSPEESYPLVVANLLKREILPIGPAVARRVSPAGRLVLAGLLDEDLPEVLARLGDAGMAECETRREIRDEVGLWVGLCLGREDAS
jgi:ribosomal protein L11 methyltransferase